MTDTWVFSSFGELERYEAEFETDPVIGFEYERDKLGRITKKTETTGAGTTETFYRYDPAGQLWRVSATATPSNPSIYDAIGNSGVTVRSDRAPGRWIVLVHASTVLDADYDDQDRQMSFPAHSPPCRRPTSLAVGSATEPRGYSCGRWRWPNGSLQVSA